MAKVSIATVDKAVPVLSHQGMGENVARALFSGAHHPIHLKVHEFGAHANRAFGGEKADVALFVWHGTIEAGGAELPEKSSAVVERGASLDVSAGPGGEIGFANANPCRPKSSQTRGRVIRQ